MAILKMEVGLIIRGEVRSFLNTRQFKGHIESFTENKSWLESEFLVKGEPKMLITIKEFLQDHFDDVTL